MYVQSCFEKTSRDWPSKSQPATAGSIISSGHMVPTFFPFFCGIGYNSSSPSTLQQHIYLKVNLIQIKMLTYIIQLVTKPLGYIHIPFLPSSYCHSPLQCLKNREATGRECEAWKLYSLMLPWKLIFFPLLQTSPVGKVQKQLNSIHWHGTQKKSLIFRVFMTFPRVNKLLKETRFYFLFFWRHIIWSSKNTDAQRHVWGIGIVKL